MNIWAYPPRRPVLLTAIVFFLVALVPTIHAGGRQEDRLSRADQLIAERRYNEAILALTAFIKDQPNRFDEAQRRLQKIVRLRDEYNALAGNLLDVLVNDPTNDERKLSMIRLLEELETAPNRSAREFLVRTKETALFTYNRAQFERIMADGRALIDSGQYVQAARRYTDGFSLYHDEFVAAQYGDLVVSRVESGLGSISDDIGRFESLIARLSQAVSLLETTFSSAEGAAGVETASEAYASAEAVFLEFANIRNLVAFTGRSFENQFLLLQGADKNLGENSFLPFAYRFVLGRKTEIRPEGVLGSMDTLWIEVANRAQNAATSAADRAYDAAVVAATSADHLAAIQAFRATSSYAELALRATALWSAIAGAETSPALTTYGRSIVEGKPPIFLKYQTLARAAIYHAQAEQEALSLAELSKSAGAPEEAWRSGRLGTADAVSILVDARASFVALYQRVAGELDALAAYASTATSYRDEKLVDDSSLSYLSAARDAFSSVSSGALAGEVDSALARFRIVSTDLERSLASRREDYEKGMALLEGQQSASKTEEPVTLKYPAESIPVFESVETTSTQDVSSVAALMNQLKSEAEQVLTDPRANQLTDDLADLSSQFASVLKQSKTALAQAKDLVNKAASARLEGDRYYEEARSALGRLNFDLARERVQRAGTRYDFSLSIQESSSLRAERDRKLLALSAEISKTENEVVVRDVRRLITEAKDSYFAEAFDKAEDALLQAQNRWRTTNVEDDPEVAYWLTLVRGALSIKTGRIIPTTAPLYPEMSQLLSIARSAYEDGRDLLAAKRKTEALARFEEAKKKLQEVRIVFPINQEASLLSLKIDQLIDPDAFNTTFKRKVTEAQAKLKTRPQEAYSELQDLAAINPSFPGLRAIIDRAEIDLGLRLPPPDPKALARSEELYRSAKRIVDANIRSQFPVALEQLNEALKLNSNNDRAIALKDRIQTDVGGQASVVLTSASERDYQRAVQELQKGNTIVALSIVEQLLQDSQNRNSPRILELQRRIQARL